MTRFVPNFIIKFFFKTQDKVFLNSYDQISNEIRLRVHVQVNRNILPNIRLKSIK